MTKNFLIPVVLLGLGSFISSAQGAGFQSPLDKYIEEVRAGKIDSAAIQLASACGVKLDGVRAHFGFANDDAWTWHVVNDLPVAYDSLGMDLVGTIEVWKVGKQFVVERWNAELDTGGFSRTLYCFNNDVKLQMLDAANFQIPVDGGPMWGMHERWRRQADGQFEAQVPFHFINMKEKSTSEPKLGEDDKEFAKHWGKKPPTSIAFSDLEPKILFQ